MGLPQLIPLVYLAIAVTFTCARRCDFECPVGKYFDQEFDGCRSCGELCRTFEEDRVIDCNNLCRSHCNSVTTKGDENTKCFSATEWEYMSKKHSLPCSTCCEAENQVCSQQVELCEDCSSFCRVGGGGDAKSCDGYCRDWCDKLNTRDWTADEEKKYGLCKKDISPLQLLKTYKKHKIITTEPTHEEMTGSAEGPDDDDEDNSRDNPESQAGKHKDKPEIKPNATMEGLDKNFYFELDGDERKNRTTTRRIQFEPRKPSRTVVKRDESFNTQWLLWIIGACAILLLLVNGILLVVMLKQRTKPPESRQSATHTNHTYGTSTADEEKKKLIPDVESQSRSRSESEKTDNGNTEGLSHVSEGGTAKGKDGVDEKETENAGANDTYSYIDPEAAHKTAAGSSDVI